MSRSISEEISLFRDRIEKRSFVDETLRILESALASRDVKSLFQTRSVLCELLKSESTLMLHEIAGKGTLQKLCIVDFLIQAFALVGDTESCLVLRYEALILREVESSCDSSLRVLSEEWLTFSEDSLANGYLSIALKGLNRALSSNQGGNQTVRKIMELKHKAEELISPFSVRTKASDYLKRNVSRSENVDPKVDNPSVSDQRLPASLLFQKALRARNAHKLQKIKETI